MKRVVNGEEVELVPSPGVTVARLDDRLVVRTPEGAHSAVAVAIGDSIHVSYLGRTFIVGKVGSRRASNAIETSGEIRAPMPGQIVDVMVRQGDGVVSGEKVLVLEAMKTQQAFTAPFEGTVTQLLARKGQQVAEGDLLALIGPISPEP